MLYEAITRGILSKIIGCNNIKETNQFFEQLLIGFQKVELSKVCLKLEVT